MKNQTKKVFAIIPSAGYGTRFDAALPKQYFNINEELIIEKTINHFLNNSQYTYLNTEHINGSFWESDNRRSSILKSTAYSRLDFFNNSS